MWKWNPFPNQTTMIPDKDKMNNLLRIVLALLGTGMLFEAIAAWKFWNLPDGGSVCLGILGTFVLYHAIPAEWL